MDNKTISDKISSEFSQRFSEQIDTERMRQKIICIFAEEINKVDFADKVKKYAGEEMDKRVFRSVKYWIIVVLTALISTLIGTFLSKFIHL